MKEILIATNNLHKLKEFEMMLNPLNITVKSLKDLPEEIDIEEIGTTFEENAIIKAKTICQKYHITTIADDSGLEVDALNKEPGIYSARYMGYDTSYDIKNQNIIDRVKEFDDRTCRFVCAIAICEDNGKINVFRDTIEGQVAYNIKGNHGFGYDPIFFYPPLNCTLADIDESEKNKISHRGKALRQLITYLYEK